MSLNERENFTRGLPPGNYAGAFSFSMVPNARAAPGSNGPSRVGEGQLTDLYQTPGVTANKDEGMFTNMHLRGRPKPKSNTNANGTRADGMNQEGFRFAMPADPPKQESFQIKLGGAELYDTDFDESLQNDSLGFGQKQSMHPLHVREQTNHSRAANMRMLGGLDDV